MNSTDSSSVDGVESNNNITSNEDPAGDSKNALFLKVSIPALKAFKTRKFEGTKTIGEVIDLLNKSLPPKSRSDYFEVYIVSCDGHNSTEKLRHDRTLLDYNLQHMVSRENDSPYLE